MARYDRPHLKEFAAVTRNEFGKGIGWYVGTIVNADEFYDKLIKKILKDAAIRPLVVPPPGVEAMVRASDDGSLLFLINHTEESKTVATPDGKRELLKDASTKETVTLEPLGVAVIQLSAADLRPKKDARNKAQPRSGGGN